MFLKGTSRSSKSNRRYYNFSKVECDSDLWWCEDLNRWITIEESHDYSVSNMCHRCHSFKSFRRMVNKWDVPKGTQFTLLSNFVSIKNITLTKKIKRKELNYERS